MCLTRAILSTKTACWVALRSYITWHFCEPRLGQLDQVG
jgi:hypothetical protein